MNASNKQGCDCIGNKLYYQVWSDGDISTSLLVTPRPGRNFEDEWIAAEAAVSKKADENDELFDNEDTVNALIADGWVITHFADPLIINVPGY